MTATATREPDAARGPHAPLLGGPQSLLPLPPALQWLAYFGFFLGLGTFLGIAELQHYRRAGGAHPWEPFLWEISSLLTTAVLTLAIYRWHRFLVEGSRRAWQVLAGHLVGGAAYILLHSAGMYGLRGLVYAAAGMPYDPGGALAVLAYEGSKDVVFYLLLVACCHGLLMVAREQQRRAEVAALHGQLQQARLDRLREQIQPHFLFNTLNLVSSVMREDVESADRILAELADLLRESLAANRAQQHRLADEMRIVEPFLSIMRRRFGPRLEVALDVEPAAAACLVPSLLLIGPVENAIKHGVSRAAGPVRLSLEARVSDGRLTIVVADSAGQLADGAREEGIGLGNLRARLRELYGRDAEVRLGLAGGHTELAISLPARSAP